MKHSDIQPIAQALLDQLSSACVRVEISGSIRRGKDAPGDIEIVALPALGHYSIRDMFQEIVEEHAVNHLEDAIGTLLDLGAWDFALNQETGKPLRNGPNWKKLRHIASSVCCDLFITDRRRWGYTFTVRTGPGDFSKALVSYAHRQMMFFKDGLLHKHAPVYDTDGKVRECPEGEQCLRIIETPEELDVFNALGLPWIEPGKRTVNLLYASVPRGAWR